MNRQRISSRDDLLLHALDMEQRCNFAGIMTGRLYRRSVAESLGRDGLLEPILLLVCDGDGWALEPERYRWGWAMTNPGREQARQLEERRRQLLAENAECDAVLDAPEVDVAEVGELLEGMGQRPADHVVLAAQALGKLSQLLQANESSSEAPAGASDPSED